MEALISEKELAEWLGLSVSTLQQWRWLGRGPRFVKVGRHVRYDPHDVRAWIKAGADSPEHAIT